MHAKKNDSEWLSDLLNVSFNINTLWTNLFQGHRIYPVCDTWRHIIFAKYVVHTVVRLEHSKVNHLEIHSVKLALDKSLHITIFGGNAIYCSIK